MAAATILDSLATAVVITDRDAIIITQNPSAEALFGLSRGQAGGHTLAALAPDLDKLSALVARAADEQRSFGRDITLTLPRRDYQVVELACRVSPLGDGSDRVIVEFVDATQSRQFDREKTLINQRVASKGIIRQLAHEIRNPLGGLRGAAQLLERQLGNPDLEEYTRVIIGEADRLVALTEGLLGPTRKPSIELLNVHEVTERVLLLVESAAPGGVRFVRDYDPSLPDVAADRDQLIQALLNIAQNAMNAMGDEGTLTIRTRALMNFVVGDLPHRLIASIEIEDDGPGVAPEISDSIFYPLVTGRDEGTGLGLPLAQDIVRRHGGLIEFESGGGRTVFMVRLPLHSTTEQGTEGNGNGDGNG
ncbi:MAG: nitrogen regulation protein NR(II) [Gammaproteobacteria bacterium]